MLLTFYIIPYFYKKSTINCFFLQKLLKIIKQNILSGYKVINKVYNYEESRRINQKKGTVPTGWRY